MIDRGNAEHYVWGGDCDGWHLVRQPGLSVIHERMPPGRAEVRHYHETARQFFFVLSGELTLELSEAVVRLAPQQGHEIAPCLPHKAINVGDVATEFLVISQPTAHGDRISCD